LLFHANMAARIIGPAAGLSPEQIVCEIQTAESERHWHLKLDNLTCRWCRCEIGNSPSVVQHLHRRGHLPRSRLHLEWGAVDVDMFASADPVSRASLGLPADQPVVIWTGRLDPVKGFEEMLAAFARVIEDYPAILVLVGDGPYRCTVEQLIRDYSLSAHSVMLGQRTDVPSLLHMADVFLFCSRTEGLPNALLEAMAAGLPIVATDVPGCRDLIEHKQTGLLASPGSVRDIAAQLCALLRDRASARRMGAQAQAWVRAHADVRQLAERWARFYAAIHARKTVSDTRSGPEFRPLVQVLFADECNTCYTRCSEVP
jgi:glycosyltransferase involved in cell wall biosynthesis